jgi:hypothetical protein
VELHFQSGAERRRAPSLPEVRSSQAVQRTRGPALAGFLPQMPDPSPRVRHFCLIKDLDGSEQRRYTVRYTVQIALGGRKSVPFPIRFGLETGAVKRLDRPDILYLPADG